jgi:hypothetical protein
MAGTRSTSLVDSSSPGAWRGARHSPDGEGPPSRGRPVGYFVPISLADGVPSFQPAASRRQPSASEPCGSATLATRVVPCRVRCDLEFALVGGQLIGQLRALTLKGLPLVVRSGHRILRCFRSAVFRTGFEGSGVECRGLLG